MKGLIKTFNSLNEAVNLLVFGLFVLVPRYIMYRKDTYRYYSNFRYFM